MNGLSLTVPKGAIYGLLGSNGAGKTTLLKMLAGIYRPDTGSVKVGGQPVYESPEVKRSLFFMPDSPYYFPQATMKSMAEFYRSIYTGWSQKRYEELVTVFRLDPRRRLSRFSKGMQRQAAFCWRLAASRMH